MAVKTNCTLQLPPVKLTAPVYLAVATADVNHPLLLQTAYARLQGTPWTGKLLKASASGYPLFGVTSTDVLYTNAQAGNVLVGNDYPQANTLIRPPRQVYLHEPRQNGFWESGVAIVPNTYLARYKAALLAKTSLLTALADAKINVRYSKSTSNLWQYQWPGIWFLPTASVQLFEHSTTFTFPAWAGGSTQTRISSVLVGKFNDVADEWVGGAAQFIDPQGCNDVVPYGAGLQTASGSEPANEYFFVNTDLPEARAAAAAIMPSFLGVFDRVNYSIRWLPDNNPCNTGIGPNADASLQASIDETNGFGHDGCFAFAGGDCEVSEWSDSPEDLADWAEDQMVSFWNL